MKPLTWEERIRVADKIGFEAMDRMERINVNLNQLMNHLGLSRVYTSFEESKIVKNSKDEN